MATKITNSARAVRLPARVTADEVEDLANTLPAGAVDLILHDLRTLDVSSEARLSGLVARVRRLRSGTLTLRVHTGDAQPGLRPDSRYWEMLTRRLIGAVLVTHANFVRKQDGEDLREELLVELRQQIKHHRGLLLAGGRLAAPIIEGPGAAPIANLLRLLHPVDAERFSDELSDLIQGHLALPGVDFLRLIADFLRETLDNAERHGTSPWDSDGPRDRLRYLSIRRYSLESPEQRPAAASLPGAPIEEFVSSVIAQYGRSTPLVEICIVDDGLGIAATMQGGNAAIYQGPLDKEHQILQQALTREGTSSTDPDAGGGLDIALKACRDIGGLFFVRSGRAFAWRDFLTRPDGPVSYVDRRTERPLPLLAGTSIGALVPWTAPVLFTRLDGCTSST